MVTIDAIELVLGTFGVASSIYDPWVGDPFAPVFVVLARTWGVLSLFLVSSLTFLVLTTTGKLNFDATNFGVILFAAGASAPIIGRGAWSLIDMGGMFPYIMCESYNPTDHDLSAGAEPKSSHNEINTRDSNADKIGFRAFLAWVWAVFLNLMSHNVSFHKLAPYTVDIFHNCSYNIEVILHGKAVYRQNLPWNLQRGGDWDWSLQGWACRLKGLLNLLILDALGGGFLVLQVFATLGEGLVLAVGSAWTTLFIAAHVNDLTATLAERRPGDPVFSPNCSGQPLMRLVESLICCKTCNHKGENCSHLTGRSPKENDKAYAVIISKARAAYLADWSSRGNGSNRNWYQCC